MVRDVQSPRSGGLLVGPVKRAVDSSVGTHTPGSRGKQEAERVAGPNSAFIANPLMPSQ